MPPSASRRPSSPGLLPHHRHPKVRMGKAVLPPSPTRHRTHPLSRCHYPSAGRAVPQRVPTPPTCLPRHPLGFFEALATYYGLCATSKTRGLCTAADASPAGAASNSDGLNQPSLQASGLALTDSSVCKVAPAGLRKLRAKIALALEPFRSERIPI